MSHVFGCNQRTNIYGDCTCNEIKNRDAMNRYAQAIENMRQDQSYELSRLRAELAAWREAVRVLADEVREWRRDVAAVTDNYEPMEKWVVATSANPIAAAAVKEALAAKPIAGSTVAGLVIGEKAEQTPGDPKGTP